MSEGCRNCYAERLTATRFTKSQKYAGLAVLQGGEAHWTNQVRLHEDVLPEPLHWRRPRRIFVCSMSDLFHKDVPFEFVDRVFSVMALCPQHTFQVLTKRPERMAEYLGSRSKSAKFWIDACPTGRTLRWEHPGECHSLVRFPLRNVRLGTSCENQAAADKRIPHLLRCPAAVRFLSCEPLLGPIDLSAFMGGEYATPMGSEPNYNFGIHQVIVGGESGPGARPMHPDWARSIRDQCVAAGVPFFFKQWGEWHPDHSHSGRQSFFCVYRAGKKAAGRVLDGRTWDEEPA